ncbi:hypothetical protein C9I50_04655 [Pseudomonas prosekii]|nr:hypothetical protein C9I50_04655 [Pseudomonas prosekii]
MAALLRFNLLPITPVGASLLAMRPFQSTSMAPDTPPSRASSLPQESSSSTSNVFQIVRTAVFDGVVAQPCPHSCD